VTKRAQAVIAARRMGVNQSLSRATATSC
jgi:hypothetical protein